jgi:hypothetical protein
MKTLHLTLKEEWFKMIAAGIKKEEYRTIKPYWDKRLEGKDYDVIKFVWGYGDHRPNLTIECLGIQKGGEGKYEWGWEEGCYVIKLGKILEQNKIDFL